MYPYKHAHSSKQRFFFSPRSKRNSEQIWARQKHGGDSSKKAEIPGPRNFLPPLPSAASIGVKSSGTTITAQPAILFTGSRCHKRARRRRRRRGMRPRGPPDAEEKKVMHGVSRTKLQKATFYSSEGRRRADCNIEVCIRRRPRVATAM